MPKPRVNFPIWKVAQEVSEAEGIGMPEAVQRVAESAIQDAVDYELGHKQKGFRDTHTAGLTTKKLRSEYYKHHPRARLIPKERSLSQTNVSEVIDEQLRLINQYVSDPASFGRR